MKVSFNNYPIDVIICMLWSIILLPVALLNVEGTLRVILGLPFILFIPGYILIFALFPGRKTDRGIDIIERIALSFGLSIAVVPLIGLGLNYTEWGIRLEPILLSIFIFIMGIGAVALYRWFITAPDKRFSISLDISLPKSENKLDRALIVVLAVSLIIAMVSLVYVTVIPKTGEKFTEFYLLGPDGIADKYPRNLILGENADVIIGTVNHEYKTINYTIDVWLINQTITYNESTNKNETLYNHMWFLDKINIMLNHKSINIGEPWEPQWEYKYTFSINKAGEDFKLIFLLSTTPTEIYSYNEDYGELAEEKINSAYRTAHLWISVSDFPKISDVLATPSSTYSGGSINISCMIFDTDGVDEVYLNIVSPDDIVQNFPITGNKTGDTYYCNKTYTVVGWYSYFIWAIDTAGHTNTSDVKQFLVTLL